MNLFNNIFKSINMKTKLNLLLLAFMLVMCIKTNAQGIPDPLEQIASADIGFVQNVGQVADESGNSISPNTGLYYHSVNSLPVNYYFDNKVSIVYPKFHQDTLTFDTLRRLDMTWKYSDVGNSVIPSSFDTTATIYNFYLSHCASGCDQLNKYKGLLYQDVYPGIDLRVYSNSAYIKMYFVIKSGTNPDILHLKFNGQDNINVSSSLLTLTLGSNNFYLPSGIAYEFDANGNTTILNWLPNFVLQPDGSIQLTSNGSYHTNQTLVFEIGAPFYSKTDDLKNIDKSILPITGSSFWDIDHDASGNPHISGNVQSAMLVNPTNSYLSYTNSSHEILVMKLDAASDISKLPVAWITIIGGNSCDGESWFGISLDNNNNSFISATTESTDLYNSNPIQSVLQDVSGAYSDHTNAASAGLTPSDQLIVRLNTSGQRTWATLFGGDENSSYIDKINGDIFVDKSDNSVYLAARDKLSSNEVLQPSNGYYYDDTYANGRSYVVKFNGTSLTRDWCTYFGSENTYIKNFAIDANQKILMTGYTNSNSNHFGIYSANMYNLSYQGGEDGFITRFNSNWNIDWSTYIGGYYDDYSKRININNAGTITIGGNTLSDGSGSTTKFPILQNGSASNFSNSSGNSLHDPTLGYEGDGFITTFNGSTLVMINSTFIGGANGEAVMGIASSSTTNDLFVMGSSLSKSIQTASSQSPYYYNAPSNALGHDEFLTGFTPAFDLKWSTYFGGTGLDDLYSASFYSPFVYIVGNTNPMSGQNTNFPTKPSPQLNINGGHVTRFDVRSWALGVKKTNNEASNSNLSLYPNPASSRIFINLKNENNSASYIFKIFNEIGMLVKSMDMKSGVTSIEISELAEGIYFAEIIDAINGISTTKFVKQ